MLELSRSPITSDRLALAGELSPALSTSRTRTRSSARHSRLGCAPNSVSSAPLSFSTDCRLQVSDFHAAPRPLQTHCASRSARRYMESVRRGLTSALTSDPHWLCPLGCFDPDFGRSLHRADVHENSDPGERTWMKSPTLHGEGTLASVGLFDADSPWLAQRWRRFGDEGEAMLFVLIYWGRWGLGDGEEMSLL